PLAEAQFRNAMSIGEGSVAVFFQRPMSATLLAIVVLVLVTPRRWPGTGGPEEMAPTLRRCAGRCPPRGLIRLGAARRRIVGPLR
ncbi:MAG: hypothetical protein K0M67_22855, partial [Thiobacillus sp.]|nr:hypothetical protein [Thiobacillus sp.]